MDWAPSIRSAGRRCPDRGGPAGTRHSDLSDETPPSTEAAPAVRAEDQDAIRAAYARLREHLPGYRVRASQGRMIAAVARAFSRPGGVAAVEAPTGTGKSMAYLIPGLVLARARRKHLVVATATVALQQQLVERDLPQFLAATGLEASVTLAKGRQRYACLRNLHELVRGGDEVQGGLDLGAAATAAWPRRPLPGEVEDLGELFHAFDTRRWDGDLDAAPVPLQDDTRGLVTTTAGGCSKRRCPWVRDCPFLRARDQLRDARVIVANHDLVLSDLMLPAGGEGDGTGGVLLPAPQDCLYVFDEAHHLAAKAIDRGSASVLLADAARRLDRLRPQAAMAYAACDRDRIARLEVDALDGLLAQAVDALQDIERAIGQAWRPEPDEDQPRWRAPMGGLPEDWRQRAVELRETTAALSRWLAAAGKAVADAAEPGDEPLERLVRDLGLAGERVERQHQLWWLWSTDDAQGQPPTARWVDLARDGSLVCHASAVAASGLLRQVLWPQAGGVLLTSATLANGGDFRTLAAQVGLPADAETLSLPSPFDLPRQALLEVPALPALPDAFEAHVEAVAGWLEAGLDWAAGNLVLFTSWRKMKAVLERLPAQHAGSVLAQGSASKPDLLRAHREAVEAGRGSTLFGLASFGEGLDLPGALCETVVVTQLPFAVPDDPVGATLAEWLESRGRNAFVEVAVPQATRTLVQYCGRLIRSETDRGRVVILDGRLLQRRYGRGMLDSLPPFGRRLG